MFEFVDNQQRVGIRMETGRKSFSLPLLTSFEWDTIFRGRDNAACHARAVLPIYIDTLTPFANDLPTSGQRLVNGGVIICPVACVPVWHVG